jgi:hypothetical protein
MATFRKRGSRWQVQVRRQGHPSITRSFVDQQDARKWVRDVERQIDRGEPAGKATITQRQSVRELLLRYAAVESPKKCGGSVEAIRRKALARAPGQPRQPTFWSLPSWRRGATSV